MLPLSSLAARTEGRRGGRKKRREVVVVEGGKVQRDCCSKPLQKKMPVVQDDCTSLKLMEVVLTFSSGFNSAVTAAAYPNDVTAEHMVPTDTDHFHLR